MPLPCQPTTERRENEFKSWKNAQSTVSLDALPRGKRLACRLGFGDEEACEQPQPHPHHFETMATPLTAPGASGTQQQQIPEPVQQQSTRNLQDIYSELDRIRAQQTALAQDHVNLSHLQAEGLSLADMVGLDSAKYQRNNEKFAKKEADVSALMDKVRFTANPFTVGFLGHLTPVIPI